MIITKEWIDTVCPNHGRTSCDDQHLTNSYGGWDGTYRKEDGRKNIIIPRCSRCYLLNNINFDTNSLEFKPIIEVWLQWQDILENRN